MPHATTTTDNNINHRAAAARRGTRKSLTAGAPFAPRRSYSQHTTAQVSLEQSTVWEHAASTHTAAILDHGRPHPAVLRQVASFPLPHTALSVDEQIEFVWEPVDRATMVYVPTTHIDVSADVDVSIRTIAAPLTEAALLSHTHDHLFNEVHSRFSPSPVDNSAFSFSEISSREMVGVAPDCHADFELVDHAMSSEDMCDSDGLAEDYRPPANEVAPLVATSAQYAPHDTLREALPETLVVVAAPAESAPAPAPRAATSPPIECPLMPWEDASPQPPVCTPEYKKLAGHLAEWAADMVIRLVRGQSLEAVLDAPTFDALGRRTEYGGAPALLVDNIRYCLMSTLLQPSVVFLAVYYIARLPVLATDDSVDPQVSEQFRRVLFGDCTFEHVSKNDYDLFPPFKAFVNGILLASKTLDDATFTNKVWHDISRIPVQDINALELASLDLLGYDLTLAAEDWHRWLLVLRKAHGYRAPFPAPIGPIRETPHGAMADVLAKLIGVSEKRLRSVGPLFLGIEERVTKRLQVLQQWFIPEEDLDEYGPLRDEYRPRTYNEPRYHPLPVQAVRVAPVDLPPPAEWYPAADPIVARPQRSSGHNAWPPVNFNQPEPVVYQSATLVAFPIVDAFGYQTVAEPQYTATYIHHHQSAFQSAYYQTCCT